MPLPSLIVIGAGRSGTASLHHHPRQHPEIAMSRIKATCCSGWEAEPERVRDLRAATIDGFCPVRSLDACRAQLAAAPRACLRVILGFLGVDDTVPLDLAACHGPARVARNAVLERMMANRATATLERWVPPAAEAAIHRVT